MITGLNRIPLSVSDSTQNYLKSLVEQGLAPEGTMVVAESQSKGRGMGGNTWQSEAGKNLLFSFVRFPTFLRAQDFFLLTKYVSLAVRNVVQDTLPQSRVTIKWPNDIYVEDRKICGMLIENSIQGERFISSISGIGLNVNQVDFSEDLPNPVSLKMVSGKEYKLKPLLDLLCEGLDEKYDQLIHEKKALNDDYFLHLYRFNEWADYEHNGAVVTAKITGVNRFGLLQLTLKNDEKLECDMKTIRYLF